MRVLMHLEYLLVLVPVLTDWIEFGHLPQTPRQMVTETILGVLVGLMVWGTNDLRERARRSGETDGLTRLFNRLKFQADIAREVLRARRLGTKLLMAYMDVDRFKAINDRYGHQAGDHLLRELAHSLRTSVRDELDPCYRTGGDEFAVLMAAGDLEEVMNAERRMAEFQKKASLILASFDGELSLGITELQPTDTPESFFARTERMLNREKFGRRRERSSGSMGITVDGKEKS